MMFHRVRPSEFYAHVIASQNAAKRNGRTFNRRESADTVTYEIGGLATAQRVRALHYVLK